jgi:hypothetical protein
MQAAIYPRRPVTKEGIYQILYTQAAATANADLGLPQWDATGGDP